MKYVDSLDAAGLEQLPEPLRAGILPTSALLQAAVQGDGPASCRLRLFAD